MIACSVEQRKREIGIRLALGAERGAVRRMVMLQCVRLALAGTLLGWLAAFGLGRFLASLLYGVKPGDPVSFLAAPLILASVALAGAWIPAVRASRVDPNTALRSE